MFITIPLGITAYEFDQLPPYFAWIESNEIALSGLESLYFLGYVGYAYYLLNQYLKNNAYSISLHWSLQLLITGILVTIIDLFFITYELITGELSWYTGYITIVSVFISVFYLTYSAFKTGFASLLSYQITNQHTLSESIGNSNKRLERFSPDTIRLLKGKLEELLKEEKKYQNPELSLGELAAEMDVSSKTLSQFINHELDTNFYELINAYRIEDVKEKLVSDNYSNYSVMGIANEAGFKSKTSFYRLFKKATDMSPAAYQKRGK